LLLHETDGMAPTRPAPIRTDGSNAFAHRSMTERVPGIIDDVIARNPDYPPAVTDDLKRLRDAIVEDAPMRLFDAPAPDHDRWRERFAPHAGDTWLGTEWFVAEMLLYRRVVAAGRYWTTRRDPFRPFKEDELRSDALRDRLGAALATDAPLRETIARRVLGALWGNRVDLSMQSVFEQGTDAADDELLRNDAPAVADHLLDAAPGPVHILMDNAGTEEAFDLALADTLLTRDVASAVTLHVKMMPVLVSDVIGEDVFRLLDVLEGHGGALEALARRLHQHIRDDRLHIVPDPIWNTDARLWELPPRLTTPFEDAALVVAKGDAHYRRIGNDAEWPPDATLADAVPTFPAPLLALRTLKSDTLVGVAADTVRRLDENEPGWRTKGTYGVAQLSGRPE
jgi:hypothetical protein